MLELLTMKFAYHFGQIQKYNLLWLNNVIKSVVKLACHLCQIQKHYHSWNDMALAYSKIVSGEPSLIYSERLLLTLICIAFTTKMTQVLMYVCMYFIDYSISYKSIMRLMRWCFHPTCQDDLEREAVTMYWPIFRGPYINYQCTTATQRRLLTIV